MSGSSDNIYSNEKRSKLTNLFALFKSPKEPAAAEDGKAVSSSSSEKAINQMQQSDLISRDLSWMKFNERVLDQATNEERNLFDRLKFLAITSSNLDEFFTIRVGSLYNYLDFGKERLDYSGLREIPFRKVLMKEVHDFARRQNECYKDQL